MSLGKVENIMSDAREIMTEEKMGKVIRLDLACGNNKKEGFIGIDYIKTSSVDYIVDLFSSPWKLIKTKLDLIDLSNDNILEDSSVFEAFSSHFLEHIPGDCIANFANELYRVLIPGGRAQFQAPYYSSVRAMQDPTHRSFISENTFLYWNQTWRDINKLSHYGFNCNFQVLSIKYIYNPEWTHRSEPAKEWARKNNINVVDDIEIIVKAVK